MQPNAAAQVEPRRLRPIDFRSPSKMARDHVRSLELTHEVFARRLSSSLTTALRTVLRLELVSISQVTYDEYLRSMANPSVLAVLALPPLPGTAIVEMSTRLGLTLVDRMLGGIGEPVAIRRPTELEADLLQELMSHAAEALEETFEPLMAVDPEILSVEFNPHFVQTITPSEMVMVLTYRLALTQGIRTDGLLTLCYPFSLLQPTTERLTAASQDEADAEPGDEAPLRHRLPEAAVPLRVQLRASEVPITDLDRLRPGDVLRLDHRVDEPVLGMVEGRPVFSARAGRRGRKLAVEVTDWRDR